MCAHLSALSAEAARFAVVCAGMPGMPPMAGMPGMNQMPAMPGMGQLSGRMIAVEPMLQLLVRFVCFSSDWSDIVVCNLYKVVG